MTPIIPPSLALPASSHRLRVLSRVLPDPRLCPHHGCRSVFVCRCHMVVLREPQYADIKKDGASDSGAMFPPLSPGFVALYNQLKPDQTDLKTVAVYDPMLQPAYRGRSRSLSLGFMFRPKLSINSQKYVFLETLSLLLKQPSSSVPGVLFTHTACRSAGGRWNQ